MKTKTEFSKTDYLLGKEHHSDHKKCSKRFRIPFRNVIVDAKTTIQTERQRKWHQGGIQPKLQPHYFVEYKAISLFFAVINHQYIDIYHTKATGCKYP